MIPLFGAKSLLFWASQILVFWQPNSWFFWGKNWGKQTQITRIRAILRGFDKIRVFWEVFLAKFGQNPAFSQKEKTRKESQGTSQDEQRHIAIQDRRVYLARIWEGRAWQLMQYAGLVSTYQLLEHYAKVKRVKLC